MAKWADYCISEVRYDDDETHIEKVKVQKDLGDKLGSAEIWKRNKVVSEIEDDTTFVTTIKNSDGEWTRGEDVHVVTINGVKYLRTDQNSTAKDNLENLPEF